MKTILVVYNEKEIVDLVGLCFVVQKAYSALEALAFVENSVPSLAIPDVMLSDLDAFTLCSRLREKYTFFFFWT